MEKTDDLLAALLFLGVAAILLINGMDYRIGSAARMGPGYFPLVIGLLLSLAGGVLLVRAFASRGSFERHSWDLRSLAAITSAVLVFGLVLMPLGFLIATCLAVLISRLASSTYNVRSAILTAIAMCALCTAIFIEGLGIHVPLLPGLGF